MTAETSGTNPAKSDEKKSAGVDVPVGGAYAKYALGILTIVYLFNFVDRQILSILAPNIKADLGISDAQLGYLYGTSFAIFYSLFGIPLGRLADSWTRKKLISLGLALWSAMTAFSGLSRGFAPLATFRIGVGIGEAAASPASYSLLADYFPPRLRGTALGIYSSGASIGIGLGVFIGGAILDTWNGWFPDTSLAPFGLKGWQAAFLAVGLPGLLMALWVASMREPRRGQSEGLPSPTHPHPFREAWAEFMALLPGLSLLYLAHLRAPGRAYLANLAGAALITVVAALLIFLTGSVVQWVSLGIGIYCCYCWGVALSVSDPKTFDMIFRCRTIVYGCLGFSTIAFALYGFQFWLPSYLIRNFNASATQVGSVVGLCAAVGGWFGVTFSGFLADKWRARSIYGNLNVGVLTIFGTGFSATAIVLSPSVEMAYVLTFVYFVLSAMWLPPIVSTVTSLVLPQARALVGALYIMTITLLGLALGPYLMGFFSDSFIAAGASPGGGLRLGILVGLCVLFLGLIALYVARRAIVEDEARHLARAEASKTAS